MKKGNYFNPGYYLGLLIGSVIAACLFAVKGVEEGIGMVENWYKSRYEGK